MSFKKIVVAGGGVLGSQIAYQSAYKGFDVTIWLRSPESIGRTQPKLDRLHGIYADTLSRMNTPEGRSPMVWCGGLSDLRSFNYEAAAAANEKAPHKIVLELDMAKAFEDADLLIEALAEDPKSKIEFYKKASPLLPEKTVIATNSSTLLPSMFASCTGRPEKYLAMHFANNIWKGNTAEIMGHPGTQQKYYDEVVEFAKEIGMVPLLLKKEQPGYILNTLLVPLLNSGLYLWAAGVSDPATIDLTWRLATGAPYGPFQILDTVGVTTAYNIVAMRPDAKDPSSITGIIASKLKAMIDEGKLGVNAGEGFYKYR